MGRRPQTPMRAALIHSGGPLPFAAPRRRPTPSTTLRAIGDATSAPGSPPAFSAASAPPGSESAGAAMMWCTTFRHRRPCGRCAAQRQPLADRMESRQLIHLPNRDGHPCSAPRRRGDRLHGARVRGRRRCAQGDAHLRARHQALVAPDRRHQHAHDEHPLRAAAGAPIMRCAAQMRMSRCVRIACIIIALITFIAAPRAS